MTTGADAPSPSRTDASRRVVVLSVFDAEPVVRPLRAMTRLLEWTVDPAYRRIDLLRQDGTDAGDADVVVLLLRPGELRDAYPALDAPRIADAVHAAITALGHRSELVLGLCPGATTDDDVWLRGLVGDAVTDDQVVDGTIVARRYHVAEVFLPPVDGVQALHHGDFWTALAAAVLRRVDRSLRSPVKLVITDLDWTVWDGSCVEDGPEAVTVGPGRHRYLQKLQQLSRHGVGLGIASRNEPSTVRRTFDRLSATLPGSLGLDDFAEVAVGWRSKPAMIAEILAAQRCLPSSVVYLDDNPAECRAVAETWPEMTTLRFPATDAAVPAFLANAWPLDVGTVTDADRGRAADVRLASRRAAVIHGSGGGRIAADRLGLSVTIGEATAEDDDRIRQLADRTTQFNLNPGPLRRRELVDFADDRRTELLTVRAADRYGDYGLVGAVFLRYTDESVGVERFMLSCRVLDRGVEDQVLDELVRRAQQHGLPTIEMQFTATDRNGSAATFLARLRRPGPVRLRVVGRHGRPVDPAAPATRAAPNAPAKDQAPSHRLGLRTAFLAELAESLHDAASLRARVLERPAAPGSGEPVAPDLLLRTVTHVWESVLGVPRIGADEDLFTEVGATSLEAFAARERLAKLTGRSLSLADLLGRPTVRSQHRQLSGGDGSPPITEVRRGTTTPVIFLPPAGGFGHEYLRLISRLEIDNPVCICQAPEFTRQYDGLLRLDELQQAYRDLIVAAGWPMVIIAGWSFGAVLALEVALGLGSTEVGVAKVLLFDPPQRSDLRPDADGSGGGRFERFFDRLDPWDVSADHAIELTRQMFGDTPSGTGDPWTALIRRMADDPDVGVARLPIIHLEPDDVVLAARVWKKNQLLLGDYRPSGTFPGHAAIFAVQGGERTGGVVGHALGGRVTAREYAVQSRGGRRPHLAIMHPDNTALFELDVSRELSATAGVLES